MAQVKTFPQHRVQVMQYKENLLQLQTNFIENLTILPKVSKA